MNTSTAIDIKQAMILLEKELGVPIQKLGSLIHLYNEDCYSKLMEASKLWNEFDRADIVKRGKLLGLNISVENEPIIES